MELEMLPNKRVSKLLSRAKGGCIALRKNIVHYQKVAIKALGSKFLFLSAYRLFTNKPFIGFVCLPWLACAFYLIFIKTVVFESSARILVEKNSKDASLTVNLGFAGQTMGAGSSSKMTYLTQEYITSYDMLNKLNERLHFKQHYQSSGIDFFSRLSSKAKTKALLDYFQGKVQVNFNPNTQELEVIARAFSAKFVYSVLTEIINNARIFANGLANNLVAEQLKFADSYLKEAKRKLHQAEHEVLTFQKKYGMISPKENIAVVSKVIDGLEEKLVEKKTELIGYQAYLAPSSAKILTLEKEISAIKQQIIEQNTRLLGERTEPLNAKFAKFQWLDLDLKFATAEYEAAQNAYSLARLEFAKQQELVVEVSSPLLPDDYAYPERLYSLFCLFIGFSIAYGIGRMSYIIVQEHID